jgi:hypothetical protein
MGGPQQSFSQAVRSLATLLAAGCLLLIGIFLDCIHIIPKVVTLCRLPVAIHLCSTCAGACHCTDHTLSVDPSYQLLVSLGAAAAYAGQTEGVGWGSAWH